MKESLGNDRVTPERLHFEIFNGSELLMPGVVSSPNRIPHLPKGDAQPVPLVSLARSGITAHWGTSAIRVFWSSRKCVTSRSVGHAAPGFVTTARAVWLQGQLSTDRSHSTYRPMATFWFAAHRQLAMSSICEAARMVSLP